MPKHGKQYRNALAKFDQYKVYSPKEAMETVKEIASAGADNQRLDLGQTRIDDVGPRALLEHLRRAHELVGGTEHHDDLVVRMPQIDDRVDLRWNLDRIALQVGDGLRGSCTCGCG